MTTIPSAAEALRMTVYNAIMEATKAPETKSGKERNCRISGRLPKDLWDELKTQGYSITPPEEQFTYDDELPCTIISW